MAHQLKIAELEQRYERGGETDARAKDKIRKDLGCQDKSVSFILNAIGSHLEGHSTEL